MYIYSGTRRTILIPVRPKLLVHVRVHARDRVLHATDHRLQADVRRGACGAAREYREPRALRAPGMGPDEAECLFTCRGLPYRALTVTGPARQRVFFNFVSCLAPPCTASIYTGSVHNVSEHETILRPVHDIILRGNLKDLRLIAPWAVIHTLVAPPLTCPIHLSSPDLLFAFLLSLLHHTYLLYIVSYRVSTRVRAKRPLERNIICRPCTSVSVHLNSLHTRK
jgi:hypothetical protein